MNSTQKAIKYIAMVFAIFLAISIISTIVGVAGSAFFTFGSISKVETTPEFSKSFSNINSLDITVSVADFEIKTADSLKVEAKNISDKFICKEENGTLAIDERLEAQRFFSFFGEDKASKIILYLPKDFKADRAVIKTGVGTTTSDRLTAQSLDFSFGAGEVFFNNLAADNAKINGGVGEVKIKNCSLANLNFNSGVGETDIDGKLTGSSEIKAGVGELNIKLESSPNDYNLDIKTGVGSIEVDGEKYNNVKYQNNSAQNTLAIKGGVGEISIDFNK